jgi:membrane protein DedA with SNARE-associated domain
MEFFRKIKNIPYFKIVFPVLAGAAAGYMYYYFIGCNTGSCAISSNPWISTAYGAFMGALLIKKPKKEISNG